VAEADAVRFACNAVNVGSTILLNHISAELDARLQAHGYQVFQIDLSEFLKAGGAAKCLVLRLNDLAA
jgi:ornithine--oxo-acid transaminase